MQIIKVMARSYVPIDKMNETIDFYERLAGEKCETRFPIPALGIEIAAVGAMHIVAGTKEALSPFREIGAAYFVDSVSEAEKYLKTLGAKIIQPSQSGPFGRFMIAEHPDGNKVEYADKAAA